LSKAFDDCDDIEEESIPAVVATKEEEMEAKACFRFSIVGPDNSFFCFDFDFDVDNDEFISSEPFEFVFVFVMEGRPLGVVKAFVIAMKAIAKSKYECKFILLLIVAFERSVNSTGPVFAVLISRCC
jgi:hypothetical protein